MEEPSFVREIRADPHSDAPRLIYADYLEEAGDPWGELIRVQVELSHLPPGDAARRELELRETALLEEFADDWLTPLRELGAEGVSSRCFQRGLIERVRMTGKTFTKNGADLCQIAPALHCLELRGVGELFEWIAALPPPAQVTTLDLRNNGLTAAHVERLARSVWSGQLTALSLAFNNLTDDAIRPLAAVPWPRLTHLQLSVNRLGPAAVEALASRTKLPTLQSLNLSVNQTGDVGLGFLARSPLAATLRELDLGTTGVTAASVRQLAGSALLANLQSLVLRGNLLGDGFEAALEVLAQASRLKRLDLRGTHRAVARYGYGAQEVLPPATLSERLGEGLLW